MQKITSILVVAVFCSIALPQSFAAKCGAGGQCRQPLCEDQTCCGKMGGVSYCDSSAGRLVCNNGYYSSCYCTRHAVMDIQLLQGCCLWQHGVLRTDYQTGAVICNDGTISPECTLQNLNQSAGVW